MGLVVQSNIVILWIDFYRPQTKLQEGNVFTPVCLSLCTRDDGLLYDVTSCLAAWSHVPSEGRGSLALVPCSFQRGLCLGSHVPSGGSLSRGSRWQTPPEQRSPGERPPLDRDLPPGERPPLDRDLPPGQRPPSWTETPFMVKSGRYASYCNAFLLLDRPITDQC